MQRSQAVRRSSKAEGIEIDEMLTSSHRAMNSLQQIILSAAQMAQKTCHHRSHCSATRINVVPEIRADILVQRRAEAAAFRACVASITATQLFTSEG